MKSNKSNKNYNKKKNYNPKGNKGSSKGSKKFDPSEMEGSLEPVHESRGMHNSTEWLKHHPELTEAAGKLAFGNPVGVPLKLGTNFEFDPPNILTLCFEPTVGDTRDESTAVNIAAKRIISFMRAVNSGSAKNYDPADIIMYILALDQAMMCFHWIKRAFGTLNEFTPYNRELPTTLLKAQGFNYDSFLENKGDIWWTLNNWVARLSSFVMPAGIDYFSRHKYLCESILAANSNYKSQLYLFVPGNFYRYDEKYESGGTLYPVWNLPDDVNPLDRELTWSQAKTLMTSIIDPLIASQDILTIMSGDILKAWGPEAIIKLESVPMDYRVSIDVNMEMMYQIKNATVMGELNYGRNVGNTDKLSGQIWQDANGLVKQACILKGVVPVEMEGYLSESQLPRCCTQILDSANQVPGSVEVVYISELTNQAEIDPDIHALAPVVLNTGTEIITALGVNGTPCFRRGNCIVKDVTDVFGGMFINTDEIKAFEVAQFDFAPKIYYAIASPDNGVEYRMFWEYINYTTIPGEKIKQCHDAVMMNEFFVPTPAKV